MKIERVITIELSERLRRRLPSLVVAALFVLGLVLLPSCSGSTDDDGGPEITRVSLPANDLVFDRVSGKLYASVPGSAGELGNHIVEIDPETGELGRSVSVGSEPEKLALSDDGRVLYVALTGAAAVRRVEVPSLTPGLQFPLGSDEFSGPFYVEDLEVLPDDADSVAVARRNEGTSPKHEGVAIYDNGRKRLDETPGHSGSNVIEFGDSPNRLYGYNNESSESGFRRMEVSSSGVSVIDVTADVITESGEDIEFADGRIYATNGQVLDPERRTLVGTFTLDRLGGAVEPIPAESRVFFYSLGSLFEFDQETFALVQSFPIEDEVAAAPIEVESLVSIGGRDLAFRSSDDEVVLFHFDEAS